jgi:hypothetical protein
MTTTVAYVHYPHWPDQARLETMAFSLNTVLKLAAAGLKVDLYLCERDLSPYNLLPSSVSIRRIEPVQEQEEEVVVDAGEGYRCVFGLGQIGVYVASLLANESDCPLVYLNDEFPSNTPHSIWADREKHAARAARLFVVPDARRMQPLCAELGVDSSKPFAVLPNVTNVKEWPRIDWHSRLGLPAGSEPFMYAGTVGDWALIPPLLSTVPSWPDEAVIIIHSRSANPGYRGHLSHLDIPGRVFWSLYPMAEALLNSLTSHCTGTFGLYANQGSNIETMGYSSGKLMRSIVCGTAVIASKYDSLSFIEEHGLGLLIREPGEAPQGVRELIRNRNEYRRRCLAFSRDHLLFDAWWDRLCQALVHHTGLHI